MSNDSHSDDDPVPDLAAAEEPLSRDDMLRVLDGAISEAARKVDSGRIYDGDKESCRQGWIKSQELEQEEALADAEALFTSHFLDQGYSADEVEAMTRARRRR